MSLLQPEIAEGRLAKICPVQGRCEKQQGCELKGVHMFCNQFKKLVGEQVEQKRGE